MCRGRSLNINIGFGVCKMDMVTRVLEDGPFSEANAQPLVQQLLSAVAHVHACDLVHRDIKLDNVLVDEHGVLTLCDFGFAKVVEDRTYTVCGTLSRASLGSSLKKTICCVESEMPTTRSSLTGRVRALRPCRWRSQSAMHTWFVRSFVR